MTQNPYQSPQGQTEPPRSSWRWSTICLFCLKCLGACFVLLQVLRFINPLGVFTADPPPGIALFITAWFVMGLYAAHAVFALGAFLTAFGWRFIDKPYIPPAPPRRSEKI